MYKCEYFSIKELVSPDVYELRGEKAWQLFDNRGLKMIDMLRKEFGVCIINDWAWGGEFSESGLRTKDDFYYKMFSQHSFGRAFDMKFRNHSAHEVRRMIKEQWESKFKKLFNAIGIYSITLEEGDSVTWVHIDIRNAKEGINSFFV
jgi:hypothetical protein